ncbi:phosphate uptake regulator PhoU [Methanobrevibacter sp.]|uniref:phosphate signaling complex PhoU family protein n=1 Tax=Methanobrevibacter sp. TaxID=66852 RepID=UPI0026DFC651|nr:phosphate uptake regulator PhoU [Methanobrevibacter sp.]MDO5823252.1 phosphate uptake regulator PhoU [Methanobrevibacter sp.]
MDKEYPSISFENRITKIKYNIEELGNLAIKSNKEVISLFDCYDEKLYNNILNRSKEIDIKAVDLERECITFMATEQPVAHDLIFIESATRVISHIKRIGRLLMKTAESIKNIQKIEISDKIIKELICMGNYVQDMLEKSVYAFLNQDMQKARQLAIDDDEVDEIYDSILAQTMLMIENKEIISHFMDLILLARNFERIADKTVNIGSRIIFMQTFKRPDIESE